MQHLSLIRRMKWRHAIIATIVIAITAGFRPVLATDGQPVLDLGILSWLDYRKKQALTEITEITIQNNKFDSSDASVTIYQPVIFENRDQTNHRLVFMPGIENHMEVPYTSAVIKPKERWGAEFHGFGVFPYHCSIHPDERGRIKVIM